MQQTNVQTAECHSNYPAALPMQVPDHTRAPAAPGRSSWKGHIRLSLVSIPVKAYTAAVSGNGQLRLNQLHQDCHHRVKYQKLCPVHGQIANHEIVTGYEYANGQYVVVNPDELDALRTESDRAITIHTLVPLQEVDPLQWSGKDYYLTPDGPAGQKSYALLRQAMIDEGLCGIAQTVWHGKEQLVVLRLQGPLIVMSLLKYVSEVKPASAFESQVTEVPEFTAEEMELARTLVRATTTREFDFSKYTNQYNQRLTQLIEAKLAGQELVAAEAEEPQAVINLMDALKASVAKAQEAAGQQAVQRPSRAAQKKPPKGGSADAGRRKPKTPTRSRRKSG